MKVLSIVWFTIFPAKYGGQKGIVFFEEELAKHVEVNCLCATNNEMQPSGTINILPALPAGKSQFFNPIVIWQILQHVKRYKPHVLLLEHPYHGIAGVLSKKIFGVLLLLHQHNLEYKRFQELGKWWWQLLFWFEKYTSRASDLILFKTKEDQLQSVKLFKVKKENTLVVPYGITPKPFKNDADAVIYNRYKIPVNHKIILFGGTLDYKPNADAVDGIFNKLAPQLLSTDCTIIICGRNQQQDFHYLETLLHPRVIMAGAVEDIERYFFNAHVFINPVLSGGGIQTKILDALSYHCTVISFDKGLTGIDSSLTTKIKSIRDGNWLQMAAVIKEELLKEKTAVEPSFFAAYDWKNIIAPVIKKLEEHVHKKTKHL